MPASTNASYVGRFAPPGRPNTTSTPSALRHSIRASTARMKDGLLAGAVAWRPRLRDGNTESSGALARRGVLELGPAARAERVVDRNHLAAARAAAVWLVVLVAVQRSRDQPEERHAR